jgi:competence protein ComEA
MSFVQRIIDEFWRPLLPNARKVILGLALSLVILVVALATMNQTTPVAQGSDFSVFSSAAPAGSSASSGAVGSGASKTSPPVLEQTLLIHIVGEVVTPGVYQLNSGARVLDAVAAAGGFTKKADQTSINLVRPISDGEQIIVTAIGADGSGYSQTGGGGGGGGGSGATKININRATAQQLDALPGIGPTLAARIVDYRNANGGFDTVTDLGQVAGIGVKLLAQIVPLVTL